MTGKKGLFVLMSINILALVAFAPGKADEAAGWRIVEGVVATVDGTPVLRSDIQMEVDFGLLEVNGGEASFRELLDVYLNRILILREIDELGGYRLTSGEVEGAYQGYLLRYTDRTFYREKLHRWSVDEDEVYRRLKNALLTTLYTESRIQFLVNILPSDIEEAYRDDPDRWAGKGLYESWNEIRTELIRETFASEKDRWLSTLRERYRLVLLDENGEAGP